MLECSSAEEASLIRERKGYLRLLVYYDHEFGNNSSSFYQCCHRLVNFSDTDLGILLS